MMFKRKPILPARPLVPSKEEILEDIQKASNDDIVFTTLPGVTRQETRGGMYSFTGHSNDRHSEHTEESIIDPNIAFSKVKTFAKKLELLEEYIKALEEQKGKLNTLKSDLGEDIKRIKAEILKFDTVHFS